MPSSALLDILDCPACRSNQGLVPQDDSACQYLACPTCETWYPIKNEVIVLMPPHRVSGIERRPVGPAKPLRLRQTELVELDAKALFYGFFATMNELCERFDMQSAPLVVDLGCSTGSFSSVMREHQTYIGFDISFDSLAFARRTTGKFYVQADAECLPIKSGSVPFFVSREVLEHLNDVRLGIREIARVAHEGIFQIPTLDFPLLYDPVNYVLARFGGRAKFGIYGYDHHELFDRAGWRALLTEGGFRIKEEFPMGTGLLLNSSCIPLHAVFSWRTFDTLPRNGIKSTLARRLFSAFTATHKIDRMLYPFGFAQAYRVTSRAT
jgi:uncharacterized protein YbaR (Trm112 family)